MVFVRLTRVRKTLSRKFKFFEFQRNRHKVAKQTHLSCLSFQRQVKVNNDLSGVKKIVQAITYQPVARRQSKLRRTQIQKTRQSKFISLWMIFQSFKNFGQSIES